MLKVLVVDDETVVRRGIVLGVDWARIGCVVVGEAASGEEGIELAERFEPNLIITDISMPKMNGIDMMNALRERGCRAHVIMLTAYSDFAYARSALRLGADDYLLKPFRDQDLIGAVEKVRAQAEQAVAPPPETAPPVRKGDKSKYVLRAMHYIAEHYADSDMGIMAIAEHLRVSEGYLSHLFKKETSYTVTSYLTQYRVHAAMKLLRGDMLKVYEVAERVGYRDVAYFSSTFKKQTGMLPSEYQNRSGPE